MKLPPHLTVEAKDALREKFFAFCAENNLSGWACFTHYSDAGSTQCVAPQGVRPAFGMSYFSAMYLPWPEHLEPEAGDAIYHTVRVITEAMQKNATVFQQRLAAAPDRRGVVYAVGKDPKSPPAS